MSGTRSVALDSAAGARVRAASALRRWRSSIASSPRPTARLAGFASSGSLYRFCFNDQWFGIDCAQFGLPCVENLAALACGGSCAGNSMSCDGNVAQGCFGGQPYRHDCSPSGTVCAPLGGIARCQGSGPTCTGPTSGDFSLRCEGTVLVRCMNGFEGRFDCARYGESCVALPPIFAENLTILDFACARGNSCSLVANPDICADGKLTVCDDGQQETFDCAALGYKGGCVNGMSPTSSPRCIP